MGLGISGGGTGVGDGGSPYSEDLFPATDDTFRIGRENLRWNFGVFSQDMRVDGNVCVGVPLGLGLSRYHSRRGGSGSPLTAPALDTATRPVDLIIENLEPSTGTRLVLASHLSGGDTNEIEFWGNDLNLAYTHAASIVGTNVIGTAAGQISGAIGFHTANDESEPSLRMRITAPGDVGIGISFPDGTLHVHSGSAGAIGSTSSADDLTVENSADAGITILTPDANISALNFGSPNRQTGAFLRWQNSAGLFSIGTGDTGADFAFESGLSAEGMRLKSTGELVIGAAGSDGSALLEVTSTTRGFLQPRMTEAQRDAIASPAEALSVWNTDTKRSNVFDGTSWVAIGSASHLGEFDANDATFPADSAAADSRNGHPILAFADGATEERIIFHDVMSDDYLGGSVLVDVDWVAASATTGGVTWGVEFERAAPGGQDINVDGFAARQTVTSTTNGTSGVITRTTITLTQAQADAIEAGDAYRLRLERVTNDIDDNMVGDAQVMRVVVRQ